MSSRILILGGTGFIGYHLAKQALRRGFKVTSVSKNKPIKKRFLKNINYIIADISKNNSIKKKIKKNFDYVVNLAGYVDHSNTIETYKSHYLGCKNVSNFFLNKKIKKFIQVGSSMEYGLTKSPQKENFKCKPLSSYGKAKFLSTQYLLNLYKQKKFPVTILRFYQVYGPYQDSNRFIPIVINSCKLNREFPCSHGRQSRDFLYISDLIDIFFLILKSSDVKGEILNIGSGKPLKIKNIIKKIVQYYKSGSPKFNEIKLRNEEQIKIYPDMRKIRKIFNWKPKINFSQGLAKTIKYYNVNSFK
jgi:nucleoside-diphosphate-sugar epimerase